MNKSKRDRLVEIWKREELQPFVGWDFSYLDGRMFEEEPLWSYSSQAATLMQRSSSVLDMGTGGGERLLELREHWPRKVVVTEDYPPNLKLATERLAPLRVRVEAVRLTSYDPMPFADGEFDLVLNRHSGFNAGEVARILAPDGTFLTQQVHGLWAQDLLAVFGAKPQWPEARLSNNTCRKPELRCGPPNPSLNPAALSRVGLLPVLVVERDLASWAYRFSRAAG